MAASRANTESEPVAASVLPVVPQPVAGGDTAMLAALLQYEGDIRRQSGVAELLYYVANETRRIVPYEQMFIARRAQLNDGFHIVCASSLATVDRNAPLIQATEKLLSGLGKTSDLKEPQDFSARALDDDPALAEYPFDAWRWQPLISADNAVFGGMLVMRDAPLREGETFRLVRVAETVSHSWRALTGDKPVRRFGKFGRKERLGALIATALILLFPVQMSALAPVEIVAERPFTVAAPFSGVIARIHVAPNERVTKGETLLSFDDVKLGNELKLAEEKLAVAKTRVERSTSSAFAGTDETHDTATMQAEYELAQAEYKFSSDVMAMSQIKAPRSGMVLYTDRRDWEGRAVNVGEPIMQVADPGQIAMRIDLPAAEQMALERGGRVKVWLDAQPLWAIEGKIENASYQARPTPTGILAFAVTAKPVSGKPRIGSRGTAQLYGRWVPLGYSILRRPISSLRQWVGI
jgi:head-tail adaptor